MDNETIEQKVARLEAENAALTTSNQTLSAQNEKLKSANEAGETENVNLKQQVSDLQTENMNLNTKQAKLQAAFDDLHEAATTEIKKLSEQVTGARQDAASGKITVTVRDKKYQVLGKRFNIPNKGELSLDDLLKDQDALERMVDTNSGHLIEQE